MPFTTVLRSKAVPPFADLVSSRVYATRAEAEKRNVKLHEMNPCTTKTRDVIEIADPRAGRLVRR